MSHRAVRQTSPVSLTVTCAPIVVHLRGGASRHSHTVGAWQVDDSNAG